MKWLACILIHLLFFHVSSVLSCYLCSRLLKLYGTVFFFSPQLIVGSVSVYVQSMSNLSSLIPVISCCPTWLFVLFFSKLLNFPFGFSFFLSSLLFPLIGHFLRLFISFFLCDLFRFILSIVSLWPRNLYPSRFKEEESAWNENVLDANEVQKGRF